MTNSHQSRWIDFIMTIILIPIFMLVVTIAANEQGIFPIWIGIIAAMIVAAWSFFFYRFMTGETYHED